MSRAPVPSDEELAARIQKLIQARQPAARGVCVSQLQALSGGNARSAWALRVEWADGGAVADVAAHPPEGHHAGALRGAFDNAAANAPANVADCVLLARTEAGQLEVDTRHEFETLVALAGTGVPAPEVLWLDETGDILGMPGFIARRAPGKAGIVDLLKPDSTVTASLVEQLTGIAATLHGLDVQRLNLPAAMRQDVQDAPARELAYWESRFLANRMEPLPAAASVFGWLRRNLPPVDRVSLVHGDLRLGNFLHENARITVLLDWEMAHLGDPLEDLAWLYRELWSPEPFLPLQRCAELYAQASGHPVEPRRLAYYRIFSEMKFVVISLSAARVFMDGQTDNLRLAGRAGAVRDCVLRSLRWIDELEAA